MLDANKISLGIAPIAWTNDDLPDLGRENTFAQCVSEMALAGFKGSEIGNKYPKDSQILKRELDLRGIEICNCWFSTFFTVDQFDETVEAFKKQISFLREMGAKVIGCSEQGNSIQGLDKPIFKEKPVFSHQEWDKLAVGMNHLAAIGEAQGIKVSFHHHMGTGVQTVEEIHRFMELTHPNVYLLFDSGHIFFSEGTQQAVDQLIEKYSSRVAHVHLKDIRQDILHKVKSEDLSFLDAVRAGVFTVPGDGIICFDYLFQILEKTNYQGWMVVEAEQDPAKANPLEYAMKARSFIRQKTAL